MVPTELELKTIEKFAKSKGLEENFVWLKEDAEGRYIEYAFKEGVPHDNRCLSWYDKPHPNAWKRNGYKNGRKIHNVNELYELSSYDCGESHKLGNEHCSPGHPRKLCESLQCQDWTYEEPVKCACWVLHDIDLSQYRCTLSQIIEILSDSL